MSVGLSMQTTQVEGWRECWISWGWVVDGGWSEIEEAGEGSASRRGVRGEERDGEE